jgi:hypothetical protein
MSPNNALHSDGPAGERGLRQSAARSGSASYAYNGPPHAPAGHCMRAMEAGGSDSGAGVAVPAGASAGRGGRSRLMAWVL